MSENTKNRVPVKPQGGPGKRHGGFQKPKDTRRTLLRLLGYISNRKWLLVIVLLCVLFSALSGVAGTYMIRPILNELVSDAPIASKISSLAHTLLIMGLIFLGGAVCTYTQAAIMTQLAHRGVNRLRGELFEHLQKLPLKYYDAHSHGELMSRFSNDADYVQQMLEQSVVSLFSSALSFIGVVCMMIYTCAPLFLLTILILAASFFAIIKFGGKAGSSIANSRPHWEK